ncbi:polysaccharide pyruvyl transferase family protein [Bacillus sp. FJAT-29814]|uniref:polysaccharide pyruvyl transferase family protein n=1 Tax=Bacillus sp. FJAT-29814 TaxID=1729688 RepID=UPI00082A554A|nr:polysaccharide pyruvyl transferase family protein [Bacillus sp. FJAT-29814]
MKFLIVGASLISGNKGVNALTRGTINYLIDNLQVDKIEILSYSTDQVRTHKIQSSNKELSVKEIPFKFKQNMKNPLSLSKYISELKTFLKGFDQVLDISEGDSFSDIYGQKRLILHSIVKYLCNKNGVKLVFMPQTIGPFKKKSSQLIARNLLNNASEIFVRDSISEKVVKEDLGIKKPVNRTPDIAFYMKKDDKVNLKDLYRGNEKQPIFIGLNISGLLYNGGYSKDNMFGFKEPYNELSISIIEYFMTIPETVIVLTPHVVPEGFEVENDLLASLNVLEYFKGNYEKRIFVLDGNLKEHEIKGLIAQMDFFIGGRMHACIAAISSFVPTVPIAYSRKFHGIWNDLGAGDAVADPKVYDNKQIIRIIKDNFENRDKLKNTLSDNIKTAIKKFNIIKDKIE